MRHRIARSNGGCHRCTHKADAHFVAHKALHARSTCDIQKLRKNTDTQLQVPSEKVHGEPSSTKNMVCRAAVARALLKGTLIISQIQAFARCLPEHFSPLGTCTIPQLQVSSKMAHVEPSSSKNKLWTQTTTSAARKSTVLGRKKEIARGLLERINLLGTRLNPQLQVSSKKAHVEPSSSKNKL